CIVGDISYTGFGLYLFMEEYSAATIFCLRHSRWLNTHYAKRIHDLTEGMGYYVINKFIRK
ncbi:hypothetical protein, partial [Enterobacter hormaechei]|uniref:hypothetical protein n=1 Tax=Enterobacter hormaechei TaxID=158836 RepID=UPI001C3EC58B